MKPGLKLFFRRIFEQKIVESLKEAHPYEEVAYDIYALENTHE